MSKAKHLFAATATLTAIFMASPADAAQRYALQTGADLAAVCANPAASGTVTEEESARLSVCGAYIQGFLGHYAVARRGIDKPTFCLPAEGVSAENVRQLFLALLEQRPQIRDLPANLDLTTSLAWGYSCDKKAAK
ncbi:Rap1a/Tai family immunity protein [Parvibaculum sp.]|uniref:Rap1a/Tai family immunity protein n=1 Tax=Parvibaculum sp. TaxID=2024848 RepID=UPI0027202BB2|nr:Rap1a/Tai family immunity protein [Parvibaculum sp.]MDO9125822.1 Rap1a/Tai family immunity protein [Parvibaculum sp.]MDP1626185.1 Rap1a/Tai family immunity protein [Parvibaculum sp.]MDP2151502.1 Rap1a/Tai family immunity protein [Parvibaculum sp.]MDP3329168.1 Rap1a/Tai family immunity protein [Parvibaculum sp.]